MVTFWDLFAELILDTLVTKDSLPAFVVVLLYLLSITAVKLFVKETINHGFSYPSCITCLTLKIRKNRNIVLSCGVFELSGHFFDNRNMQHPVDEWVWSLENDTSLLFNFFFNLSPRVVSVLDFQGHAWRRYTYAYSSRLM